MFFLGRHLLSSCPSQAKKLSLPFSKHMLVRDKPSKEWDISKSVWSRQHRWRGNKWHETFKKWAAYPGEMAVMRCSFSPLVGLHRDLYALAHLPHLGPSLVMRDSGSDPRGPPGHRCGTALELCHTRGFKERACRTKIVCRRWMWFLGWKELELDNKMSCLFMCCTSPARLSCWRAACCQIFSIWESQ